MVTVEQGLYGGPAVAGERALLYCQSALYRKGVGGSGLIGIQSASAQPSSTSSLLHLRAGGGGLSNGPAAPCPWLNNDISSGLRSLCLALFFFGGGDVAREVAPVIRAKRSGCTPVPTSSGACMLETTFAFFIGEGCRVGGAAMGDFCSCNQHSPFVVHDLLPPSDLLSPDASSRRGYLRLGLAGRSLEL